MEKRIVVFHPMQQHSFRTAEALLETGSLQKYYTCIYYDESKIIYKLLGRILGVDNIKRMKGRCNGSLNPFIKTYCTITGLLFLLSLRLDSTNRITTFLHFHLSKKIGKKVAKQLINDKVDIVIGYDGWTFGLIKELKKRKSKITVIVDFSSLYAEEIISIVNTDIELNPSVKKGYAYSQQLYTSQYIKYYSYEIFNANFFISPSLVVDNSLIKYGVNKEKIFRAQYGMNFKRKDFVNKNKDKTTFIYIGRLSYAKGVHYLLEAFNKLDRNDFELILVGEDVDGFSSRILNKNIIQVGSIHHDMISEYLDKSDVAISASVYDGFSLALLESASYNLPIICTSNTGISDFVQDYENGFVVKPFCSSELTKKIEFFLNDKESINQMGLAIGKITNNLSWGNYNKQIWTIVNTVMDEVED